MLKGFVAGILFAVVAAALSLYAVIATGTIEPGADEPIPEFERWIAKTSLRAYLQRAVPKVVSPLAASGENLRQGVRLYARNCAVCHGYADGKETAVGSGLYKKPNLFADEDWSQDADGLVYWFIDHGVRLTGMPAFNKSLSQDEIWQLVLFIKNIKKLPADVDDYWRSFKEPAAGGESPPSPATGKAPED